MSQFSNKDKEHASSQKSASSNGDTEGNDEEQNGPLAFIRKLKKGVETGLARPVPGILKIIRQNSDQEGTSTAATTQMKSGLFAPPVPTKPVVSSSKGRQVSAYQLSQFDKVLNQDTIDLNALRKLSWNGVPPIYRPIVWQILLGYLPIKRDRRDDTIRRKRKEYQDSIPTYFTVSEADRTTQEGEILRQILVDLPRTCPNNPFFHQQSVRKAMERILYIWSIRHPASGYVQGMNDLLTPLLLICMQNYVDDPLRCDVASLDPSILVRNLVFSLKFEFLTIFCF
jgi:hypothetical protein